MALAPLGGAGASLVDQLRPGLLASEFHHLHISPRAVGSAALLLIVGLILTRLLRRWLQQRLLPTTSLDLGVRSSIVTGLSYAGVVLALIAATSALGIALDKITLIASALSVGIGFGLQSIIQNFVSGIILLVERPIKVGDWVSASGAEGTVRRIKVRATEIAMPDGSVTIVPNSSFISANVQNRTEAGIEGRIDMTIKVMGDSSAAHARDAILKAINGLSQLQARVPPKLLLTDAADGAFSFTLQAYPPSLHSVADAKSDLLFQLTERLSSAGLKASVC
jgi:small-conductance mechanosensitive channel